MKLLALAVTMAVTVSGCAPTDTGSQQFMVEVGKTAIRVPLPAGFREASALSPAVREAAEELVADPNRLLGLVVPEAEIARIENGGLPSFERYMLVHTFEDLEGYSLSPGEFAGISDRFVSGHERMIEQLNVRLARQPDERTSDGDTRRPITLNLARGDHIPLGLHTDRLNAAGYAAMTRYRYRQANETRDGLMVAGMNIMRVRGKLLYASVYHRYEGQADAEWVRTVSEDWVASILTTNTNRDPISRVTDLVGNTFQQSINLRSWTIAGGTILALCLLIVGLMLRRRRTGRT